MDPPSEMPAYCDVTVASRQGRTMPLLLSGRTQAALRAQAARLRDHLLAHPDLALADVAYSLAMTRTQFRHRVAVVATHHAAVLSALSALSQGEACPEVVQGEERARGKLVFVFSGQGAQWPRMAAQLLQTSPVFREQIETCAAALSPYMRGSLLAVLRGEEGAPPLDRADIVQPALFAMMVGLAALWRSLGVEPDAVVGHSQGEIAAACVAGALSLEDAARVVALRSRVLTRLSGHGAMAAVELDAEELAERLARFGQDVSIAAHNGPRSTVLSGAPHAIDAIVAELSAAQIFARKVRVDYASHHAGIETLRNEILAELSAIRPQRSSLPIYSTVSAEPLTGAELNADYFFRNLRQPVRFREAVERLLSDSHRFFVEVTPHPVLGLAVRETAATRGTAAVVASSLRRDEGDEHRLLLSLCELHCQGLVVDWPKLLAGGRRVPLPTYAFQRKRYLPDPVMAPSTGETALGISTTRPSLLGTALALADGAMVFTSRLSLQNEPWLGGHVVLGVVLVPGSLFVELSLVAARAVGLAWLEELTLQAPLALSNEGAVALQISLGAADAAGRRTLSLHARADGAVPDVPWVLHATGILAPGSERAAPNLRAWPPTDATPIEVAGCYERLSAAGITYAPQFQGLSAAWKRGDELFAEVQLCEELRADAERFGIHPVLLDAALHPIALDTIRTEADARLAFSWTCVSLLATGARTLRVRLSSGGGGGSVSVLLTDANGEPVLFADAFASRPVTRDQLGDLLGSHTKSETAKTRRLPAALRQVSAKAGPTPLEERLAALSPADRRTTLLEVVRTEAASVLRYGGAGSIDPERPLKELGLDSLMALELRHRLATATGLRLPSTLLFDHPTPSALVERLQRELPGGKPQPMPASQRLAADGEPDPIAIVAMSCRFPGGVSSPDELWTLLCSGADAISSTPEGRGWHLDALYDPDPSAPGKTYVRQGGFLKDADLFDPTLFGITPREALAIDPQQRLLLETAWETIERAGLKLPFLQENVTGVFVGVISSDYGARPAEAPDGVEGYLGIGSAPSVASGRIAYTFGLQGPAITVDTACSSSLVALHLASQSLRSGECSLALVGGVTVMATPNVFIEFSRQRALSPDGRCRTFSADANGTGWSEGAGMLLLERLSDARRHGHPVLALIRGSAVNQDGRSQGLTAPNGPAQERVILQALRSANLSAADVDAVEAHGTATTLGDPIEAQALLATYGAAHSQDRPLWLGSIKSNIGHTQAAAGLAAIMKMVLALEHEQLPKTLYAETPTPHVDWSPGTVRLLNEPRPWRSGGSKRRAGISAFGISGTNAHVIIEEPLGALSPLQLDSTALPQALPLILSAHEETALRAQAARLREHMQAHPELGLGDVAYSLATERTHFLYRAAVVSSERQTVLESLAALSRGDKSANTVQGEARIQGKVVFVFPGQGAQWPKMAVRLLDTSSVFRERIEACATALAPYMDASLLAVLREEGGAPSLDRVDIVQPALFAVMVGLAALWQKMGIEPDAVVGHSQGEIAAAYVAGALSLEDAARVVALRSRAIAKLSGKGAMASVELGPEALSGLLARFSPRVSIAAQNSPRSTVLSGDPDAIDAIVAELSAREVFARKVRVDYASHHVSIEAIRAELLAELAPIRPRQAAVPFYSSVTMERLDGTALDADYFFCNLRQPVRFHEAVQHLLSDGHRFFIELSPHPVLTLALRETIDAAAGSAAVTCSLRRDEGDERRLMLSLCELYGQGLAVDFSRILPRGRHVPLPTYPFQRQRYWLDPIRSASADVASAGLATADHPLLGASAPLADGGILFTGRLSLKTHPWLGGHVVLGAVLIPGAAFLELALMAARRAGLGLVEELTLQAPLSLPKTGAMHLQILVSAADEKNRRGLTFHARIEDAAPFAPWVLHATATLAPAKALAAESLRAWPPEGATALDASEVYALLGEAGLSYEDGFRGLSAVWRRGDELFAEARLPAELASDAGRFGIHPALLDAALQPIALDLLHKESGAMLAFSWTGASLLATGARSLRVRLGRGGETGAASVLLTDADGEPVLVADAFRSRPITREQFGNLLEAKQDALFRVNWQPLPEVAAVPKGTDWAVLGASASRQMAGLAAADVSWRQYDDLAQIQAASAHEPVPAVVVALFVDVLPEQARAVHAATHQALSLLQTWLGDERLAASKLVIVTRRAVAAEELEDVLDLVHAPLWGLVRVAQSERPDRSILLVDIDRLDALPGVLSRAVQSEEPQLAVRQGVLRIPRLVRPPLAETAPRSFDRDGTLLLTGGTGTLGALFARHLCEQHGAQQLLLVSREGPAAAGAQELQRSLERFGAHVRIEACDVADRDALDRLLASIPAAHPLTGVVHIAGVLDDGVLSTLTPERIDRVFLPKVDAALHLHELTRRLDLSVFVLFSSVSGVIGTAGQANYAAANAFLDALAHRRRAAGLAAVSLAWGFFAERSRLTAGLSNNDLDRMARLGMGALSTDDGLALFDAALVRPYASLVPARLRAAEPGSPADAVPPLLKSLFPAAPLRAVAVQAGASTSLAERLAALPEDKRSATLLKLVRDEIAGVFRYSSPESIEPVRPLKEHGLDSLMAIELRNRLGAVTGLRLPSTLLFDHPTPAALVERLRAELFGRQPTPELTAKATVERTEHEPIAIVAMSCRYPGGADSPEALWELLRSGADAISTSPAGRGWHLDALYDPDPNAVGKSYVREGGFLHDADRFDPQFFGITPREALTIDPQQRLLLETSWEAIERAGIEPAFLQANTTGVFVGVIYSDYGARLSKAPSGFEGYLTTGSAPSVASGRIAYTFGLQGPAITVDTACSSSLVALHLASQSLRSGECSLALVGGVTVMATPNVFIEFSRQRALSPDGRCRTFSADANGTGWSEGAGMLLLERLSDARRHGHPVLALIRGSAVNQDGRSQGLTAPNGPAQERVILQALRSANLSAADVDAVEAHGTATTLGDPIEAQALLATYGAAHSQDRPLWLGSIKSNIGHTQAAAGLAGVMKMVLALRHEILPKTLHAERPTPHVDWSQGVMRLLSEPMPWIRGDSPRRAAVSAFGISGTNAHVVLEEPPKADAAAPQAPIAPPAWPPCLLSARSQAALRAQAERLLQHLQTSPELKLVDLAYTLAIHRSHFQHRAAIAASERQKVLTALDALAGGKQSPSLVLGSAKQPGKLALLFTGQGSQYAGMGRALAAAFPVFRESLSAVCMRLDALAERPLQDILFAAAGSAEAALLDQTTFTQTALFALEVALFRLLESFEIRPDFLMGHSIGEITAAHVAGVLSLDDACTLVSARARLIQRLPAGGAMVSLQASESEVLKVIATELGCSIAALNGPLSTVISGDESAVMSVARLFELRGRKTKRLAVSHAFHSPRMDEMLAAFRSTASSLAHHPPSIPIVSNCTGGLVRSESSFGADYWVRHVRQSVRFFDGVRALEAEGVRAFLELGPNGALCAMAQGCLSDVARAEAVFLPLLSKARPELQTLSAALCGLHVFGYPMNWKEYFNTVGGRQVDAPTYAFQRERYWLESATEPPEVGAASSGTAPGAAAPMSSTGATPTELPPSKAATAKEDWVIGVLREELEAISGINAAEIDSEASLIELGLDSLMLSQLIARVKLRFGIEYNLGMFFREAVSASRLARDIAQKTPDAEITAKPVTSEPAPELVALIPPSSMPAAAPIVLPASVPGLEGGLTALFSQQLSVMQGVISQQLNILHGRSFTPAPESPQIQTALANRTPERAPTARPVPVPKSEPAANSVSQKRAEKPAQPRPAPVDYSIVNLGADENLTDVQRRFIAQLIERRSIRTAKSKQYAERYRRTMSDWINVLSFRRTLKELSYPLVAARSEGSRIWDIDDNEYVDIAVGYGVNFFGHRPPFVVRAIEEQLRLGFELGPQNALAGDVAERICKLTGMDRVTFCNTGSEAVMVALRLARTITGRDKIVRFKDSYHGTFDGVLAVGTHNGLTRPMAMGTPLAMVQDVLVLDYGDPKSLEIVRKQANQFAAVLVEPVQSRRPNLQPTQFLRELRSIATEAGAALVFDEVITGFRIHPGGAQAHFGVQADIVTYGKLIGGGMPIGVIACRGRFLDALDGGPWRFGDDSYPSHPTTVFGGTFCKHPLAMAAARAVLIHLEEQGPALQEAVNQRTARLTAECNAYFKRRSVPFWVHHFASQYRFETDAKNAWLLELFFHLLIDRGIYTWERRICYLSAAHSDADVDFILAAMKAAVDDMLAVGFFGNTPPELPPSDGDGSSRGGRPRTRGEVTTAGRHDSRPTSTRVFPMSSVQRRMFAFSQSPGGELALHITGAWRLQGFIDPARLERALQQLIDRHDSLRTGFELLNDTFVQVVHETCKAELTVVDAAPGELHAALAARVTPFDLAWPPLLRFALVRDGQESALCLDAHHIVVDGASIDVLFRELVAAYDAARLPPPSAQYPDYARWVESRSAEFDSMAAFFLEHLEPPLPALSLPTDHPRPPLFEHTGQTITLRAPAAPVLKLARERRASTFMVLLSAYYAWLYRITGQDDLVIGTVTITRDPSLHDGLIGMTTNTVALRARPSGAMRFGELLDEVRRISSLMFENAEYPFERLVERLAVPRDASRHPICQTLFSYEKPRNRTLRLGGALGIPIDLQKRAVQSDIDVEIMELDGVLELRFSFAVALFHTETMHRLTRAYCCVLDAVTRAPEQCLDEIPLVDEHDAEELYRLGGGPPLPALAARSVIELIEKAAEKDFEACAVVHGDTQVSYARLLAESRTLAHFLIANRMHRPEDRIGIVLEPSSTFVTAVLGVLAAGCAFVPIDPADPIDRIRFIIEDSGCRTVLTDASGAERIGGPVCFDVSATPPLHAGGTLARPRPEQLAYIIYTSGTTGRPKGVAVEHRALSSYLTWANSHYFGNDDTGGAMALFSSPAFDFTLTPLFLPLLRGQFILILDRRNLDDVLCTVFDPASGVDTIKLTPSHIELLRELPLPDGRVSGIRRIILGGEALRRSQVEILERYAPGAALFNEYGPTESTVGCTIKNIGAGDITIGRPIAGTRASVRNQRLGLLPVGIVGELCVGGAGLARGYFNRPELTAARFPADPSGNGERLYRTGDLARWTSSGELQLLGRIDHQVKLRGFRIELDEIEAAISALPAVRGCTVAVREDAPGDKRLVAYVVMGGEANPGALREALRAKLPEHMVPSAFVQLKALPLTKNGKVDRQALPVPEATRDLATAHAAPRTATEHALVGIWQALLVVPAVGVEDDFFALGGDSLRAIRLLAIVRTRLGWSPPFASFLVAPTIRALAAQVDGTATRPEPQVALRPVCHTAGEKPYAGLSSSERRLWFIEMLSPGARSYQVPHVLALRGAFDEAAMRTSLVTLAQRHETLRTTYKEENGAPVRVVLETEIPVRIEDVSMLPLATREEAAKALICDEVRATFDLGQGPLTRGLVVRIAEDAHLFILHQHHIVTDEWSAMILVQELSTLYTAALRRERPSLHMLPYQVSDYARAEQHALETDAFAPSRAYWRRQLAAMPRLSLPIVDTLMDARPGPEGHLFLSIPEDTSRGLLALARASGATRFSVWHAALAAVLSRYSGQTDFGVGTLMANREVDGAAGLLGFFANTVVLRTDLSGNPTFRQLLQRVRAVEIEAHRHQALPFDVMVRDLGVVRRAGENPLFDVSLIEVTTPETDGTGAFVPLSGMLPDGICTAKDVLTVAVSHGVAAAELHLSYDASRVRHSAAERFLGHLRTLLVAAVEKPDARLAALPILTEAELAALQTWSGPAEAPGTYADPASDASIIELFEAQAAKVPGAIAADIADQTITYAELDAQSNRLARHLQKLGAGPEVLLGISCTRSMSWVVAILGVLKAGAAYVPIEPSTPTERFAFMLEDASVKLLLTEQSLAEQRPVPGCRTLFLDSDAHEWSEEPATSLRAKIQPNSSAYVIYTSGSTGSPKGVVITHRGLPNLVRARAKWQELRPGRRILLFSSFAFDAAVSDLLGGLAAGASVVIASDEERASADALCRRLADIDATVLPPAVLPMLSPNTLPQNLSLAVAGEACPREEVARFSKGRALLNFYGPTETTVWATAYRTTEETENLPIGRAIDGMRCYVLDGMGALVPTGGAGELYIAGIGLARAYLNRPDLTAERFILDPFSPEPGSRMYRTGDLVRWNEGGNLEFVGRVDRQVKVRGYRIELEEIESIASSHPTVNACIVLAREDAPGEKRLVAYVVPRSPHFGIEALREHLQKKLPDYMVPSAFVVLSSLPLSQNGKVDRQALPVPTGTPDRRMTEYLMPRTPQEHTLVAIWEELLGVSPIGVQDDFFALGGHSLLTIKMLSAIRERLGVALPVASLFSHPTIKGLTALLESAALPAGLAAGVSPVPRMQEEPAFAALSGAERRLWFLDKLSPDARSYQAPLLLFVAPGLDEGALAASLSELAQRHEILRTIFPTVDGAPVRCVLSSASIPIRRADVSGRKDAARAAALHALLAEEIAAPFNLSSGPLSRALLISTGSDSDVLCINQHHIITDEWSSGVLLAELFTLYHAALRRQDARLPPLPYQMAEYARAEQAAILGGALAASRVYWKDRLTAMPRLELPIVATAGAQPGPEGRISLPISPELSAALHALARSRGCTLFMAWYAVLAAVLCRYSQQTDFGLGAAIANRVVPGTQGLVGLLTNTVVLRTDLSGDPEFDEILARVRRTATEAYAHQALPFDVVVQDLGVAGEARGNPLYDVSFLEMTQFEPPKAAGFRPAGELQDEIEGATTAKEALSFAVRHESGRTSLQVTYDERRVKKVAIARLLQHLLTLLADVTRHPKKRLSELELANAAERELISSFNETANDTAKASAVERCIHELFEEQARNNPDIVAIECQQKGLTYAELDARATRLAAYLHSLGVGPEVRVGLCAERSPEFMIGLLGILKAGGAFVPMDPAHPPARLAFMIADAQVSLLLTQAPLCERLSAYKGPVVRLDADADRWENLAATPIVSGVKPEHAIYVIYTSGSTGQPKGVLIEHRGLATHVGFQRAELPITVGDRVLQHLSVAFDGSVFEWLCALCSGATLVIAPAGADADAVSELLQRHEITVAALPPALLAVIPEVAPSLRHLVAAGDRLPTDIARRWARGRRLLHLYGPTETSITATCHVYDEADSGVLPIGRPIYNVRIYVLDAALRPCPIGITGEIFIAGIGVGRGYVGRPDLTAERFLPDPFSRVPGSRMYRTGDLARWNERGSLEFLGRIDHQVKLRGFRIELAEIEAVLSMHPAVESCIVTAREDVPGDKRLVAYVVCREYSFSANELRLHLRSTLPDYMIPAAFVHLRALPISRNGKVDRSALPRPQDTRDAETLYIAPRTNTEEALVSIWKELIGASRIGIEDDFFKLGGNSLLAVRLAAFIERHFCVRLPLSRLFSARTVASMAVAIDAACANRGTADAVERGPIVVALRASGTKPPLYCVHAIGGTIFSYEHVARELGTEQPVYGLQAQSIDEGSEAEPSIEGIAERLLEAIRRTHPRGPYALCGWSFGGVVAFEMAGQLQRAGLHPPALVLLDTPVPGSASSRDTATTKQRLFGELILQLGLQRIAMDLDELCSLPVAAAVAEFARHIENAGLFPQGSASRFVQKTLATLAAHEQALRRYAPQRLAGTVALLKASDRDEVGGSQLPSFDWSPYCAACEVQLVPGTHHTMLAPPNATMLARVLSGVLTARRTSIASASYFLEEQP